LDSEFCPGDEIEPIPERVAEDTDTLFPTVDVKTWLLHSTVSCVRAEAMLFTELVNSIYSCLKTEMGWSTANDAKTSLQEAGVAHVNLNGRRIAVYMHPNHDPEKVRILRGGAPGIQLENKNSAKDAFNGAARSPC